jgi:hypothetical protein
VDGVGMARAMSRPRATESQTIDNVLEGHVVALVGDPQDGGDTGKKRRRGRGMSEEEAMCPGDESSAQMMQG